MECTHEYLYDDMIKRDSGIIYGESPEGKINALKFKEYANSRGLTLHVVLTERKEWYVVSERHFNSVNDYYIKRGVRPLLHSF